MTLHFCLSGAHLQNKMTALENGELISAYSFNFPPPPPAASISSKLSCSISQTSITRRWFNSSQSLMNLKDCSDWLCADSCDVWMEGIMKWEWKWVEWGQSKKKKLCNFAWNFVLLEFFVAILTCIDCWWWWFHQHFHSRRQTWLMSADCWTYGKKSLTWWAIMWHNITWQVALFVTVRSWPFYWLLSVGQRLCANFCV